MNNIFKYATKELSQDAFLCWSINWLNEGEEHPLYNYGKEMLDLFLGEDKQEKYCDVQVFTQYKKIDVLVMFKDKDGNSHALILEDKTNTSEHDEQIKNYKNKLENCLKQDEGLKAYINAKIHIAYVKTGIMYDKDLCIVDKGATVIDLDDLLGVVSKYEKSKSSEILSDFYGHINGIHTDRKTIRKKIDSGEYEDALYDRYGQFYFLDKLFSDRDMSENDNIYAGTNRGGTPWTEYVFWRDIYPLGDKKQSVSEEHSLFWRVDRKWDKKEKKHRSYIALRHYDYHAHSVKEYLNERKKFVYRKFRAVADKVAENHALSFENIGVRENYKESDLLFIYLDKVSEMKLDELSKYLVEITNEFIKESDNLYDGMEEALKDYKNI